MVDRLVGTEVNARRIQNVENCFGGSGQPLIVPGRVLVGEGVLIKLCRKKPKQRQFFLFNDILVYGTILIAKRKYHKQHIIPLEDIQLEDLPDEGEETQNGWLIKTRTKSFAVYAATASEKREWMVHIQRTISELIAKSGKQLSKNHAAVWIPDTEAQLCMHHCRKCGRVTCSACSNRRFHIAEQSSKPVRVCVPCFTELSTAQPNARQSIVNTNESANESSGEDNDSEEDDDLTQKHASVVDQILPRANAINEPASVSPPSSPPILISHFLESKANNNSFFRSGC